MKVSSTHTLHAAFGATRGRQWVAPQLASPALADDSVTGRRWLTTFPATPGVVREALLGALSDMHAQLAYLYQADDKVIVRALLGEYQIRTELAPLDAGTTRIVVVALRDGDVDRALSCRIVDAVEANLH